MSSSVLDTNGVTTKIWNEFWKVGEARANVPGIRARVTLTQPRWPAARLST